MDGPGSQTSKQTMTHLIFFFKLIRFTHTEMACVSVAQPKERKNSSVEKGRNGRRRTILAATDSNVSIKEKNKKRDQ